MNVGWDRKNERDRADGERRAIVHGSGPGGESRADPPAADHGILVAAPEGVVSAGRLDESEPGVTAFSPNDGLHPTSTGANVGADG
jgi:hypothetical protein